LLDFYVQLEYYLLQIISTWTVSSELIWKCRRGAGQAASPQEALQSFGWAVFLLLLTGFALASWMGSFYVFAHPEDPCCYKILQALDKIEPIKRSTSPPLP